MYNTIIRAILTLKMDKEIEDADSQNGEEEEKDLETEEDLAPEGETAEEKAERLENANKQLFERAKKAEGFEKVDGKWVKKAKPVVQAKPAAKAKEADLSTTDVYALMKADVPEEDIEEVRRVAKALGVNVAEAIKDPVTKGILERRLALRTTANATNTRTARPGTKKVTDEQVLEDLKAGTIPEKGSKEAEQLFWAKRGGKK